MTHNLSTEMHSVADWPLGVFPHLYNMDKLTKNAVLPLVKEIDRLAELIVKLKDGLERDKATADAHLAMCARGDPEEVHLHCERSLLVAGEQQRMAQVYLNMIDDFDKLT